MSRLGVLFALNEPTVSKLRSFEDGDEMLGFLQEEIEAGIMSNHPDRFAELDKSWDALHRSLTDGKLSRTNGELPLNHVVLGGEQIYEENDYTMSLKTPQQVAIIAEAIEKISEKDFHRMYFNIDSHDYGFELTEDDFNYTWTLFQNSVDFWKKAAAKKLYVLFTVDH